jgi:acyl-CoA thioesterase-1
MGLPADQAFPAVLQRRLARTGLPFRLVNAGVSGDTTGGGLGRLAWLLKQDPDVVVVELGANDAFRGMDLEQTEANLRAIVAGVREHGAAVLLLGMRLPPSYGQAYARAFDALYDRIAADTGVAYVPFFMRGVAGVPELQQADGIHPTAEGHRRLAENVREPLARLLREMAASRAPADDGG